MAEVGAFSDDGVVSQHKPVACSLIPMQKERMGQGAGHMASNIPFHVVTWKSVSWGLRNNVSAECLWVSVEEEWQLQDSGLNSIWMLYLINLGGWVSGVLDSQTHLYVCVFD